MALTLQPVIKEDIEQIISEFKNDLSYFEGKKVLITGGNGLIPSYIADVLAEHNKSLKRPCSIIIMNRNPTNENSRLGHLLGNENVTFIAQDTGEHFDIPSGVNVIIHAASRANPTAFLEDPIDTIDANVNATKLFLDYAKNNKIDHFIFFSSAEIYGNPLKDFLPTIETYPGNSGPLDKYSCYIESKRFCETLCHNYFKKYSIPVKMLRVLLTYGPGIRNDGKAVSDFFDRAIRERLVTLRDAGEARRSFCYITDAVKAIFVIMFKGVNGEAYNIGNDLLSENITIRKLAEVVGASVGSDVVVKPNFEAPKREIYGEDNRWVNIAKLRALGFEPKVMIEEGIARTKRYYDEKNIL